MPSLRLHPGASRRILGFALIAGLVGPACAQWQQWGGPQRDFNVQSAKLATDWGEDGPKRVWERKLAGGYSCVLVQGERLYTMSRDGEDELVLALDAKTGETVWEHRYPAPLPEKAVLQFGEGPNATPLIIGDRIITVGFNGHLACLSLSDGKPVWTKELIEEMGGTFLNFGYSSSPLAFRDTVIVPVGGEGKALVAFKVADGSQAWSGGDLDNSFSSPILIEVGGQQQVVTFFGTAVVGQDPTSGKVLWSFHHENQWKTNIVTPIWGDDNILYISSGQAGSRGLKLSRSGDETKVEEVWSTTKMQMGHTNVVRIGSRIYGSSGESAMFLTAIEAADGEIAIKARGFDKANLLNAGGTLVILAEDGTLALARPKADELEVLCQAQVLENKAWTVPTLIGNRLLVRDTETLALLDLQ